LLNSDYPRLHKGSDLTSFIREDLASRGKNADDSTNVARTGAIVTRGCNYLEALCTRAMKTTESRSESRRVRSFVDSARERSVSLLPGRREMKENRNFINLQFLCGMQYSGKRKKLGYCPFLQLSISYAYLEETYYKHRFLIFTSDCVLLSQIIRDSFMVSVMIEAKRCGDKFDDVVKGKRN